LAISFVWSRWGFDRVSASVERPSGEMSVGEVMRETITLRNRGAPPKTWVEVEDRTTIPGVAFGEVVSLPGVVGFRKFTLEGRMTRRGIFTIGPLVLRAADPFGLFPKERAFADQRSVLVYPRIVELPDFAAPSSLLTSDTSRRRRTHLLSPEIASVRDYNPGDSVSRIHWRSTARTGKLMVKTFDQGRVSEVWVIFDQHAATLAGEGAESTDEYGATVAASAIDRYVRQQLPVGFASAGSPPLFLMPDRGPEHRSRILRHIAASRPDSARPLFTLLAEVERHVGQGSTVLVVTAAPNAEWVEALGALQKRGAQCVAVVLDRGSFGAEDSNESAVDVLVGYGVRTYVVKRGASISGALSQPVLPGLGEAGVGRTREVRV